MNHKITKGRKSSVSITVTLTPEELAPFMQRAASKISEQAKIEGFRPGRAPYEVVKATVGEQAILTEAADEAIRKYYVEIAKQEKLEPIGSPEISIEKIAPGNELSFTAIVSVIPTIELGDYGKISVTELDVVIGDEQVDRVINELRDQRATEALVDRPATTGDKVEVDFDVFRDGVPIEGGSSKKYPLIIGQGRFIPGFEEQIIGMRANEVKEFKLTFPKEYGAKHLAGKECEFKVKITSVFARTLPELNDALASELGFPTVHALREQIQHNLYHEEDHKQQQRIELELVEKLVEKSKIGELPDVLVSAETDKMVNELKQHIMMQGLAFADYLAQLKKSEDQLRLDFVPQAIKRVQSALVTRAIFFKEQLAVTPEDITKEQEEIKRVYAHDKDIATKLQTPEMRDYLENIIGNRKVMEFLKTRCVKSEKKPHTH